MIILLWVFAGVMVGSSIGVITIAMLDPMRARKKSSDQWKHCDWSVVPCSMRMGSVSLPHGLQRIPISVGCYAPGLATDLNDLSKKPATGQFTGNLSWDWW